MNLKKSSLSEMKKLVMDLGLDLYRADQIFQWFWQKNVKDFSKMTNLSLDLRRILGEKFILEDLKVDGRLEAGDGANKFLFKLEDEKVIEGVYIPEGNRRTVCVSTQVGCSLGCKFCATALVGFRRNLLAWEIANQVQIVQSETKERITNVVFMGMGEPLLNIKEVFGAVEIISSSIGLGISQRHITLSTAGIIEGMEELLNSPLKIKLAISLNFPDEEMRKEMMPVTRKNPIKEVLRIAREYSIKKQMVTFEYVMIKDLNDRLDDARRLLKLLKGIPSKINLIPYNEYPGLPYRSPNLERIIKFQEILYSASHTITLRKSKGQEILAGCGQLAGRL